MTNNQILLKEIIKQECQNSSEYNNENSYFEFFAANQVLKDYEFSNEEIENGIIGGSNDGGCDAAYIFLNDEIIAPDQLVNLTCPKGAQLEFAIFIMQKHHWFWRGCNNEMENNFRKPFGYVT